MTSKPGQFLIRTLVLIIFPLMVLMATLLPFLLFQERLPNPLATHWGRGGIADDSMPIATLMIITLFFVGVPAAAMLHSGLKKGRLRAGRIRILPVWAFAATLIASVSWQTIRANFDVPDWQQATLVQLPVFVNSHFLAAAAGVMIWLLTRLMEPAPEPELPAPTAHLQSGERGVWIGSAKAIWARYIVYAGGAAATLILLRIEPPVILLLLLLVTPLAVIFMSIKVIVNHNGMRISFSPFNWPTKKIPLGDILQARSIHVEPLERGGGWGYRGSLRLFNRAAIVLRRGEGIELQLKDNKRLVVTVDDAETGAGLINDLLARSQRK